jgi:hypothetical protein
MISPAIAPKRLPPLHLPAHLGALLSPSRNGNTVCASVGAMNIS